MARSIFLVGAFSPLEGVLGDPCNRTISAALINQPVELVPLEGEATLDADFPSGNAYMASFSLSDAITIGEIADLALALYLLEKTESSIYVVTKEDEVSVKAPYIENHGQLTTYVLHSPMLDAGTLTITFTVQTTF